MRRVVTELQVVNKWVYKRKNAIHRNIKFELSVQSIRNLLSAKKCYYTGAPLTHDTLTLDRVDNTLGYVKGNVVACHKDFNSLKSIIENPENPLDVKSVLKGMKLINKRMK